MDQFNNCYFNGGRHLFARIEGESPEQFYRLITAMHKHVNTHENQRAIKKLNEDTYPGWVHINPKVGKVL